MRRAGMLTEPIEIYKVNWIKDEFGNQAETLELKCSTRARLDRYNGNRNIVHNEITYNYNKTFICRSYVDVDDFDRVKFQNRFYRVLSIDTNTKTQEKTINTQLIND